jgi:hypothetical protein
MKKQTKNFIFAAPASTTFGNLYGKLSFIPFSALPLVYWHGQTD